MVTLTAVLLLIALVVIAGAVWLPRFIGNVQRQFSSALAEFGSDSAKQIEQRTADVDRRLATLGETLDRRLGQLDTKVDRRLETAQKTSTEIHERLGKVDSAAAQMLERAKDLSRLEQALRPPKARGGFGELLLENLLRDRLPSSAYSMQHTFDSGERVDAVVRVGQLIPVDSKFPLDNYERIVGAENDDERLLHEKAFARDVKQHIDAIARKYIRPSEGTYDFAFMYIASEGVYYELACGKTGSILQHAHRERVFPVSPSTFTAYLQVIALGLKGMQIEERAQEVMAYVADLGQDFNRFVGDFETIGTHLGHAQKKYTDADNRLTKFSDRLDQALEEADETIELAEAPLELEADAA